MILRGWGVEGLKDDLNELLPVALGVEGSLGVEMRGLVGRDSQLVVEGVVPDLLHVVPRGDDAVLDGVLQGEDTWWMGGGGCLESSGSVGDWLGVLE